MMWWNLKKTTERFRVTIGMIVLGTIFVLPTGCRQAVKQAAKDVAKPGIEESLKTLAKPENKEMLGSVFENLPLQRVAHTVGHGIAQGALEYVTGAAGTLPTTQPATTTTAPQVRTVEPNQIMAGVSKSIDEHLSPALGRMTRHAVHEAIEEGLGEASTQKATAYAEAVAEKTGRAAAKAFAEGLEKEIGPAIERVIDQKIGPAIERTLSERVGPGIQSALNQSIPTTMPQVDQTAIVKLSGGMARAIGQEFTLGVQDALQQVKQEEKTKGQEATVLNQSSRMASSGDALAQTIMWTLAALVVALAAGLIFLVLRLRKRRQEWEESRHAVEHFANVLHETQGKPWATELQELLRQKIHDPALSEKLHLLLRKSP